MKQQISLPPRIGGAPVPAVTSETKRIIVVGANGAGKSRFGLWMQEHACREPLFGVSALRALYGRADDNAGGEIDTLYRRMAEHSLLRGDLSGEFERLLALLLDEEAGALFRSKYGGRDTETGPTRLERLMAMWEEVFPDNRMLVESGRMLFSNRDGDNHYETMRLSDGEKAVIYYLGCALLAAQDRVLLVDNPGMFLNRALLGRVWDMCESLRQSPMVYVTHDLDFATTRASAHGTMTIWVKRYDAAANLWDYELLPEGAGITEEVMVTLLGARKPVLFIEGDGVNSIDARLYPLVFRDYTVKSLGSCNKVIEATRTFNSLAALHSLAATGIVDRDRRTPREVDYLRKHNVLVPDVAEIENILMMEEVVRAVADYHGRNAKNVFGKVSRTMLRLFAGDVRQQALLHTRHRVKTNVEYTIDRRFDGIDSLERHLSQLIRSVKPRAIYESVLAEFRGYIEAGDYASVLRVYNCKSMLSQTNVGTLTGCRSNDRKAYVDTVLRILAGDTPQSHAIAAAIRRCFSL